MQGFFFAIFPVFPVLWSPWIVSFFPVSFPVNKGRIACLIYPLNQLVKNTVELTNHQSAYGEVCKWLFPLSPLQTIGRPQTV